MQAFGDLDHDVYGYGFSRSEVVLHSNLQNLGQKTKNILENTLRIRALYSDDVALIHMSS